MDFNEIDALKKEDVKELLLERVASKLEPTEEPIQEDDPILDIELDEYKDTLIRERVAYERKLLIDNNCATIVAFPESTQNHTLWVEKNIIGNPDAKDAKAKLQAIQAKEIELANYVAPPSAKEVIIEKIKAEKSPTVAKLMGYLQELIEVI